MDPKATLIEANSALRESGNRSECGERLADYFGWRLKGGFQPMVGGVWGDTYAAEVLVSLGEVADTLSEALDYSRA